MFARWVAGLPSPRRESVKLFIYSLQTPMLLLLRPKVRLNTPQRAEIVIPLTWFSKNLWRTMFFAAIAAGADLTGGFAAIELAPAANVGFLYKSFSCRFLRRVDGDLVLVCDDGEKVAAGVETAARTGERVNVDVRVYGLVEKHSLTEPVFDSALTLSFKQHKKVKD